MKSNSCVSANEALLPRSVAPAMPAEAFRKFRLSVHMSRDCNRRLHSNAIRSHRFTQIHTDWTAYESSHHAGLRCYLLCFFRSVSICVNLWLLVPRTIELDLFCGGVANLRLRRLGPATSALGRRPERRRALR